MMDQNLEKYLKPTDLMDWEHPVIQEKAAQLFFHKDSPVQKAEPLFDFIREIPYAFHISFSAEDYKASAILKANRGFCTQKAILFCTLARCAGIPAGIHFYDIVDYTLADHFTQFLKTNTLVYHGITSLYLNGKWLQYDATIDTRLAARKGMRPVVFSRDKDCLNPPYGLNNQPNIEYIKDRGLYADVTFSDLQNWYKKNYSHLSELDLVNYMVEREERKSG